LEDVDPCQAGPIEIVFGPKCRLWADSLASNGSHTFTWQYPLFV